MQELEKILEEIKESFERNKEFDLNSDGTLNRCVVDARITYAEIRDIIRKHMNDGWIPVEERLPEVDAGTEETIEDDDCPEYIVTIRGASESTVLKYSPDGAWFDENGYVYDVIAWRPLPEPYRPERSKND